MDLIIENAHVALWNGETLRCAIGKNGFAANKTEGDKKTPIGRWIIREVYYRADRMDKPDTRLPCRPILPDDGWCDDPDDRNYNRRIDHPYPASAERLWRDDQAYDLVAVMGFNDDPPVPGIGSAVFLHIARENFDGTDGCVALSKDDLLRVLREAEVGSAVLIAPRL